VTFVVTARGGQIICSERDRWKQLDGSLVGTAELTTSHTLPGFGRVVTVARVETRAA